MDFDITTVRKLTPLRNADSTPFPIQERLTILLNQAELINVTHPGTYRDELIVSFKQKWAALAPMINAA